MSVSGFSVQHDPQVQQYKKLRAQILSQERGRKAEQKAAKREMLQDLEQTNSHKGKPCFEKIWQRLRQRCAGFVCANVVLAKQSQGDSDSEGEVRYFDGKIGENTECRVKKN